MKFTLTTVFYRESSIFKASSSSTVLRNEHGRLEFFDSSKISFKVPSLKQSVKLKVTSYWVDKVKFIDLVRIVCVVIFCQSHTSHGREIIAQEGPSTPSVVSEWSRCTLLRKMSVPKGTDHSIDKIKELYPLVNESETPLPRSWSPKDKFNFIGLSQNNLKVHYKGHGKGHKDAASVRATHSIPAACGLYYFEVKIISKGRDGYMGIGLSASGVNMNRLPGWDKHSYGYHGDDGHSFCSSGTGQPYGPTFTTDDIIGCGVNLLDNTCFYTKNGHHLGIAFTDLPPSLYPTVGLQTPGEVVEANFGQHPFKFDIEDMIKELKVRTRITIQRYPIPDTYRNWEGIMNKMVMSYLVHHGYCSTAEAFAKTCGQAVAEDLVSMQNRQKIQRLVLDGNIPEAERETKDLYPNLLESNPDLLFALRCRHFVELVGQSMNRKCKPINITEVHENNICNGNAVKVFNFEKSSPKMISCDDMEITYTNGFLNGSNVGDENMETENCQYDLLNPNTNDSLLVGTSGKCSNLESTAFNKIVTSLSAVEQLLQVGRELQALSVTMRRIYGFNENNKKLLENAFSLLAYADPWDSPVGWQLSPRQREPVCAALNSAILQSIQLPRTPPLQVALHHAHLLLSQQARSGLGACAFIDVGFQADFKK
ncbi:unnamed protein product [Allacma fusca]|uniref:Ran-binding protein 9 n=1 Tax=Allacma fusca TaxID=39272 RepID=A0A8J2LAZ0_9HEXA|nr:unnamed protein product [Allacma fusca]